MTWLGHAPSRIAGVSPVPRPTVSSRRAVVRRGTVATTLPSGPITPDSPLVEATTSQRPDSRARRRVMANCWSTWSVWMKVALLVWTARSWAPCRTWSRRTSS